jgi:hypothetical protein
MWLRCKLKFRVCLSGHYFPLKDETVEIVLQNVMRDNLAELRVKDRV